MKKIFILISLFFVLHQNFGQGLNNNYQFDDEDLKNVLSLQGINVFKFPFCLNKGEYVSISYCIYENGIEKERCDLIEDLQIETGFKIDHHLSRRDTTIFHRFYFLNQGDSVLNIRIVAPGITTNSKHSAKSVFSHQLHSHIFTRKTWSCSHSMKTITFTCIPNARDRKSVV